MTTEEMQNQIQSMMKTPKSIVESLDEAFKITKEDAEFAKAMLNLAKINSEFYDAGIKEGKKEIIKEAVKYLKNKLQNIFFSSADMTSNINEFTNNFKKAMEKRL